MLIIWYLETSFVQCMAPSHEYSVPVSYSDLIRRHDSTESFKVDFTTDVGGLMMLQGYIIIASKASLSNKTNDL